ncbi:hypothetical protein GGR54DRAFT_645193 [Hypoxylon sp. NC1633]|nr:hypothetical protein GGR54DRAFT_645193 [Hypoxylon sp. NC1633]
MKVSQQSIIIAGWPCVGKSWLASRSEIKGYRIVDLDSSKFSFLADGKRNPRFVDDYTEAINSKINDKVILMVSTHQEIRQTLTNLNLWYALVMPGQELREDWIQRMVERGTPHMVPYFRENWDVLVAGCLEQQGCHRILLESTKYLVDVIDGIIESFGVWKASEMPTVEDIASSTCPTLEKLHNDQGDLIGIIRDLAKHGMDIQIPWIAIVGDRFSGKSFVLEAVTGLRFPVQD